MNTEFDANLASRRDSLKEEYRKYSLKGEAFATDAIRFCAASKRASQDLKTRSVLRRTIGKFTGANNRLRDISQEGLLKSLEATHEVLRSYGKQINLLTDCLYSTQLGLIELIRRHDDFAKETLKVIVAITEKLDSLEEKQNWQAEELKILGDRVDSLSDTVAMHTWCHKLPARQYHKVSSVRRLFSLATSFIRVKPPMCWSKDDLGVFEGALMNQTVGMFERALVTEKFFEDAFNESGDDFSEITDEIVAFSGKPFHLFSGMTWPSVMLWELLNNREAFQSGKDLRQRLLDIHGFEIPDQIELKDLAYHLLLGLKPLFDPKRVSDLMEDLMLDAQMEFADRLAPWSSLLGNSERLFTETLSYDREWCAGAWGYKAVLLHAPQGGVDLHQQYLEQKDGPRWRLMLSFRGDFKKTQQQIRQSAEDIGVGGLGWQDDGCFEIVREFPHPRWADWNTQRVELADHARKAYDFVANTPMPPH